MPEKLAGRLADLYMICHVGVIVISRGVVVWPADPIPSTGETLLALQTGVAPNEITEIAAAGRGDRACRQAF